MESQKRKTKKNEERIFVKRIAVEGLFGQYNYDLLMKEVTHENPSQILILYGDNGSGKSTLLRLIFLLLSPTEGRGHKSSLAKIKFRNVSIELSNGTTISANRKGKELIGGFTFTLSDRNAAIKSVQLPTGDTGGINVPSGTIIETQLHGILREIQQLNISAFYLTDKRKKYSNEDSLDEDADANSKLSLFDSQVFFGETHFPGRKKEDAAEKDLKTLLKQILEWVRKETIRYSEIGDTNANETYDKIIRDILSANPKAKTANGKQLTETFIRLAEKATALSRFGLMSRVDYKKIINSYNDSTPSQRGAITKILATYVNVIQAKTDALENLHGKLSGFIDTLNSYLKNKQLTFNITNGLEIQYLNGDNIESSNLSSGEKQLLTIFSHALISESSANIFIIDEPEISLNIKWQRKLINSLLEFTHERNIQFIFATHSIELLTQHVGNVVELKEKV